MTKVYLHLEETEAPVHTFRFEFDEEKSTFNDLITNFVVVYNLAHPRFLLTASNLQLFDRDGKKLLSTVSLISSSTFDRDDLSVRMIDATVFASAVENMPSEMFERTKTVTSDVSKSNRGLDRDDIVNLTGEVEKNIVQKSYRSARILCEKGLTLFPAESYAFFDALARINLANSEFDNAITNALLAVAAATKVSVDTSLLNFTLASALFSSSDGCDEAEEILEKMLRKKFPASLPTKFTLDVRALRAECLFNMNQHEAAAKIVNDHMQWDGAEQHLRTLIAYTRFAMTYNKIEEPVRAMLKAIVIDQNSKTCRRILAELLSTDMGYIEFTAQVPPTFASAAAYAFLATAVKECSAMLPCIKLLREAARLRPQSASFALNLVHALEIICDYNEAFSVIKTFCSKNLTMKVGNQGFSGGMLLLALNGFFPAETSKRDSANERTHIPAEASDHASSTTYDFCELKGQYDRTSPATIERELYSKDALDFLAVAFTAVKIAYLQGNFTILPALHSLLESTRCASSEDLHMTTIRNEHAYYQCIIEVLADRNISVGLARTASDGSHGEKVSIIDSQAADVVKFTDKLEEKSCVGPVCDNSWSLKLSIDATVIAQASTSPIYIVGDSHCLSPAWSILHIEDSLADHGTPYTEKFEMGIDTVTSEGSRKKRTPRLLIPRLVTGVKQWHLRPKGDFYTKANFHQTVSAIPSEAEVIFIVGEIDCREGLLVAVERGRYPSLKEGIECTVDIFIAVLAKLIATKKFKVLIHPVVPVLKETRSIVTHFNAIYKRKVESLKGAYWLDFFDDLLSADCKDLNLEYAMDGTHLRPSYVNLLEQSIQKHYSNPNI